MHTTTSTILQWQTNKTNFRFEKRVWPGLTISDALLANQNATKKLADDKNSIIQCKIFSLESIQFSVYTFRNCKHNPISNAWFYYIFCILVVVYKCIPKYKQQWTWHVTFPRKKVNLKEGVENQQDFSVETKAACVVFV